ncbi:hypothetical protein BGZ83_002774 [Gryganskiella cystojenkinii]|nr:hypothetical protein BGZ83_002774 [Gryganskiella cystojenkinii]
MTRTRSPQQLFSTAIVLALVVLNTSSNNNHVLAQSGISTICNNCLTTQLGLLPSCAGVNLSDPAQQSTPQYHTCICNASFGFNWTQPCATPTTCQAAELTTFESTLLQTLNVTCIKPTPSPSPTPTKGSGAAASTVMTGNSMAGWATLTSIVLLSMVAL